MNKSLLYLYLIFSIVLLNPFNLQARKSTQIEPLINSYLSSYALSPDNLFKLAAFTELKGRLDSESQSIYLDFGALGEISFYPKNCLLRTGSGQVFTLSRYQSNSMQEIAAMNDALFLLFENIALLANNQADPHLVAFVDESLARKNIEPFNKIFVRHILINYGRYNASERKVEFHSDWLPEEVRAAATSKEKSLVKKHKTPLMIRLDDHFLRGYYIFSGGTVYVEDVERDVKYATGEEFDPNVTAFKVFVQKLFVQSAQFIARNESKRLETESRVALFVPENSSKEDIAFSHKSFIPEATVSRKNVTVRKVSSSSVAPLYHEYNWIAMMLNILREENISIADPEVLIFFIDKPYFDRIYSSLNAEERVAVDKAKKKLRKN